MTAEKRPLVIYLASPYSNPDFDICLNRFIKVTLKAKELIEQGYIVYSPITHSHPIACHMPEGDHLKHDIWLQQSLYWLDFCDELWVLKLRGWRYSYGIKQEIRKARSRGLKVRFLD